MFDLSMTIEAVILVTALSIDTFVSCFAYGANKIKIPFSSVMVINIICCILLTASLFFGAALKSFISEGLAETICFLILLILGVLKLFDSTVKTIIKKYNKIKKQIKFKFLNVNFILNIYANPEDADIDSSRVLSPKEAAYLAIALSLDGLAVGFGAGLTSISYVQIILFSLIITMAAAMFGSYIGNKLAEKISMNLSWISGIILIILAFTKLK